MIELMIITNDNYIASIAESVGVDIIFIDLETIGKYERQGHLNTHITDHKKTDVFHLRKILNKSKLLVRVNPLNNQSEKEIDTVINYGADIVMLPMFKSATEVKKFIDIVNGRAKVMLLLETAQAFVRVDDILCLKGIDRIHVGLNDLHLSLGLDFMFEPLSYGLIEYLANKFNKKDIKWGFGGISRIGDGQVPSRIILGEHVRLGSSMVILSRGFKEILRKYEDKKEILKHEIYKIRTVESQIINWSDKMHEDNLLTLKRTVNKIVNSK